MAAWHLTLSSVRRLTLFPSETERRRALQRIDRVVRDALLLFCIADDHLHLVVSLRLGQIGRLTSSILSTVRCTTDVPLEPVHRRPVASRSHPLWLVRYFLLQPTHHGLSVHPAGWDGSCFQDL